MEYLVLAFVISAYEFHLREDGTRGVASKLVSFSNSLSFFRVRIAANFMFLSLIKLQMLKLD